MSLLVKICGLSNEESLVCAVEAGADMVGFVFHSKSPRNVSIQRAAELATIARGKAKIVALVVDADDRMLTELRSELQPDLWQFHGKESIQRIADVRRHFGLPVMKALGWSGQHSDYDDALHYEHHVDRLLFDAKPPKDAAYPGGHGQPFDWSSLATLPTMLEFMLSGGLSPENIGEAIRVVRGMGLNLTGVDVSSGVESAPGIKDLEKIKAFIAAAREADKACRA